MANKPIDNAFTAKSLKQSAGDPTYAGALSFLRRQYTKSLDGVDAVVWGVPFDTSVSNRPGTRFGPRAIREASAIQDNDPWYPFNASIQEQLSIIDYGDCAFDYGMQAEIPKQIEAQAAQIIASGAYLLTLGGDHFVTYPLLKAHAAKYGPLALVQFDAHQDTWDDDGGRIDHGTFITRAVNEGIIDADRSIQIGIRTHAPNDYGLEIIFGHDMVEMSAADIAERIYKRTGGKNVYVTFDIDCLDPAFAPGTGTPVAGGPTSAHALAILHHLKNLEIVGSDVVEVSPPYDHAQITAIVGSTIATYMLGLLAQRKSAKS